MDIVKQKLDMQKREKLKKNPDKYQFYIWQFAYDVI